MLSVSKLCTENQKGHQRLALVHTWSPLNTDASGSESLNLTPSVNLYTNDSVLIAWRISLAHTYFINAPKLVIDHTIK